MAADTPIPRRLFLGGLASLAGLTAAGALTRPAGAAKPPPTTVGGTTTTRRPPKTTTSTSTSTSLASTTTTTLAGSDGLYHDSYDRY